MYIYIYINIYICIHTHTHTHTHTQSCIQLYIIVYILTRIQVQIIPALERSNTIHADASRVSQIGIKRSLVAAAMSVEVVYSGRRLQLGDTAIVATPSKPCTECCLPVREGEGGRESEGGRGRETE
jgi:hypothetical protein